VARKTGERRSWPYPADTRAERVRLLLERVRKQWGEEDLSALATQLWEFANALDAPQPKRSGKKRVRS
jgi:hypothetical protein